MTWRVGRHQPRNIYRDNDYIAVAIGPDKEAAEFAGRICAALNTQETLRRAWGVDITSGARGTTAGTTEGKVDPMTNQDSQRRQREEQERQQREQREQERQQREQEQGQQQEPQQPDTSGQQ